MKHILKIFLIFFLVFSNTFAYELTNYDKNFLDKFYSLLEKVNPEKIEVLDEKINLLIDNYSTNTRINYLLSQISYHISNNYLKNSYDLVRVIDGDTIKIIFEWQEKNVRMIWLDAPENSTTRYWYVEEFWNRAKNKLEELIWNNQKIYLEFDDSQWKYDKYYRLLWYVFVDWKNLNWEMIRVWYASEYTYNKNYKYRDEFLLYEQFAKQNNLWIWWENLEEKTTNNNYKFYTSSYHSAYLYYCETDSSWQNLSKKYLKIYDSEEELLKDSINNWKILNKKC